MEQETTKISIPVSMEHIYKIHVLNELGDVKHVFVFCANLYSEQHLTTIFSETELIHYKENDVEIIFSPRLIHKDDSIHEIKLKIVAQLVEHHTTSAKSAYHLSTDEIYLFGNASKDVDMVKLFQEITQDEKLPLTKERFFQHLTNISADPYVLDTGDSKKTLNRDVFHYDDWMAVAKSGIRNIFAPIGMEFQGEYDFRFPGNPYNNQVWTQPIRYELSSKNPLLTFEKSVLLDYTQTNDIMVCLAKNVYQHSVAAQMSTEYVCNLYFPFLQKRGLNTIQLLSDATLELSEETMSKIKNKANEHKNFVLDTYREIEWTRKSESDLPYIERGIKDFSVTLRASDFAHSLPIDMLFRNLHATEAYPFIKYNPGARRENMFRLYSKEISADGRKIPVLDESLIMRLSRELGKSKQVSVYIHGKHPLYINIHANSEIEISGALSTSMAVDELDSMIINAVSPVIRQMNSILTPSGYTIRNFEGIYGFHTYKSLFTYKVVLPVETKVNLEQHIGYLTTIFDVFSTDISKGATMRFKRVRNYREMDAKFTLIREIFDRTANTESVIQGLIDNFAMTEDDAISLYGEFRSQFQVLNQQIIENPGFSTEFQMIPMKNEIVVEMSSISSPAFLDIVHMYIDTILRVLQQPKSITLSPAKLKSFKSKMSKQVTENRKIDDIDVVIAPIELKAPVAKPMRFSDSPEAEVQELVTDALDFDDDFDYEYEEGNENVGDGQGVDEDSDADFYGGQGSDDEASDEEGEYKVSIDGMSIKNPSPFYKRMLEKDPVLYVTEETSKFPLYSKACPSGDKRQPVLITDEEKQRIDRTNPGSYGKALLHGSSSDKKNWYICPRFWCLKTNSSISEADVKAGKCGAIIPRGADRVPPGAYVYEFNNPRFHMKDGEYVQHVPGFLKKNKHPDGLCIPCCFSKEWDSKDQKERRDTCDYHDPDEPTVSSDKKSKSVRKKPEQTTKMLSYIISSVSYPLPQSRWGFMPESLQLFLKNDSSKVTDPQNSALILSGQSCLLRYGVEKSDNQSFLACFAYYYAYKNNLTTTPTVKEMRTIFVDSITLDLFIQYHNGNLVSIFRPKIVTRAEIEIEKYADTEFYKTITLSDETQVDYLEDTIASYENFRNFIQDEASIIDHSYLWDFFCNRNPKLLLDGMNLIILHISDNDITEKVQMICPSNAYSPVEYNARKETVILVKQGDYYEPIHLYERHDSIVVSKTEEIVYTLKRGDTVKGEKVLNAKQVVQYTIRSGETEKNEIVFKKAFVEGRALEEIKDLLKLIQATTKKYCAPLPSMPRKYSFKRNIPMVEMIRVLKSHHYQASFQVLNYRNKSIGILVRKGDDQKDIFVPCFPSAIIPDMKTKYMDDVSIWNDYRETRDRLNEISTSTKKLLFTKPSVKIVDDGMVVGFLTETNQFVQINPPTQPLDEDGIPIVEHSSYSYSDGDKTLSTHKYESRTRRRVIRNINLETQFYNIFRSMVRIQLNDYTNRKIRSEILNAVDEPTFSYSTKLKYLEKRLHFLMDNKTSFQEIDSEKLRAVETVVMCGVNKDTQKCEATNTMGSSTKFCLTTDDDKCLTIFPKTHLLSGKDNNAIYFGRMADELVRYSRIRLFMFQPKTYMNITDSELHVNDSELFLLESRITRDYFRNMARYNIDKYVRNIEFDNAQPEISQTYDNKVSVLEQKNSISNIQLTASDNDALDKYILDCIQQTKPNVIGNNKPGSWRIVFPSSTKELIFNNTGECSFIPIIYIFQQVYKNELSIKNIKTSLWKGYSVLLENSTNRSKIYSILRNQGKRTMIDRLKTNAISFESLIFSEEYYITDLDWWVFCKVAQLPVILFSSTTLKYLSSSLTWLKLGGKGLANEKFYFVRSPVDVKPNVPPAYHILQPGMVLSELNNDMFVLAERGDVTYTANMQSIETFLQKITMISSKPRAQPSGFSSFN
jgi:hypothetical protein